MTAHISLPSIESKPLVPASLSENIVKNILIDELGFKGLIITDALNMAGVTKHFTAKEVAVMAVQAGIDLILMPQGEKISIEAIEHAVKNGIISEDRINLSVKKILETKEWLKLNENKFTDESLVSNIFNSDDSKILSQKIADASITKIKNDNGNIPFGKRMTKRKENCLVLSLNNGSDAANSDYFIKNFKEKGAIYFTDIFTYDIKGDVSNQTDILKNAEDYTYVVVPVYAKVKIKTGTVGLPSSQTELINNLVKNKKQVIVISFGNPYLIQGFEDVDSYICAYGDSEPTINAVNKVLFGEIQSKGKLPITISDIYKFGFGLTD
jgi:beta-glucosidase-like glycosyl hydrolase